MTEELKPRMDKLVGFIIFIFLFISLVATAVTDTIFFNIEQETACESYGMTFHDGEDFDYCISENEEAHFVIMECTGMVWYKECIANFVNVGEVRVK